MTRGRRGKQMRKKKQAAKWKGEKAAEKEWRKLLRKWESERAIWSGTVTQLSAEGVLKKKSSQTSREAHQIPG